MEVIVALCGTFRSALAAGAILCASGAWLPAAADLVAVTWNPSGANPPLSTQGQFTFSDMTLQDMATVVLTPDGAGGFTFTESGYLPVASFLGLPFVPGFNGTPGATAFGLMGEFVVSGTIAAGGTSGSFSSVNLQLVGDPGYLNGVSTLKFNSSGQVVASDGSSPNALPGTDV